MPVNLAGATSWVASAPVQDLLLRTKYLLQNFWISLK